jgi:hypothetical protein
VTDRKQKYNELASICQRGVVLIFNKFHDRTIYATQSGTAGPVGFDSLVPGIMRSNPVRGMDVCLSVSVLRCPVYVEAFATS